ncbi:hypothetical protein [Tsukamurella sp. PLM1]|uniref:hypothetical protein n=1 Tax=Tsukamurella sp. PLM1 TaxID=2929795 RepID=UPI0020BE29CB|nr:hypothetical protein [Tsukamurella sp. PLM1]
MYGPAAAVVSTSTDSPATGTAWWPVGMIRAYAATPRAASPQSPVTAPAVRPRGERRNAPAAAAATAATASTITVQPAHAASVAIAELTS